MKLKLKIQPKYAGPITLYIPCRTTDIEFTEITFTEANPEAMARQLDKIHVVANVHSLDKAAQGMRVNILHVMSELTRPMGRMELNESSLADNEYLKFEIAG